MPVVGSGGALRLCFAGRGHGKIEVLPRESALAYPEPTCKGRELAVSIDPEPSNEIMLLVTDLNLALTMAQIALTAAAGSAKRECNQANARETYDRVLHRTQEYSFAQSDRKLLFDKLGQLRSALERLEEKF